MTADAATTDPRRSRGDRQRDAIITAVRDLLQERSFADLSVSTISERAGVARSGFYFYFDSKYAVLAVIVAEADGRTRPADPRFRPARGGGVAVGVRHADGRLRRGGVRLQRPDHGGLQCWPAAPTPRSARSWTTFQDTVVDKIVGLVESRRPGARPVSDDLPALVRTLPATTSMTLTRDSSFVGRGVDPTRRAPRSLERLWLTALWGGADLRGRRDRRPVGPCHGAGIPGGISQDKRCFLTGAASGIGRATALRLAAQGAELYLTDRDAEGLSATVSDARALGAEVPGAPGPRHLRLRRGRRVRRRHPRRPSGDGRRDEHRGISAWGTVDQLTHAHWSQDGLVNLMGPIHVIETFLPPMVAAGRGGHLVNVSSAAGLVALPWHAAYSASKYGLRGLSEVLRFDLARHRIGVSVVVPGAVKTPLVNTVEIAGVDRDDPNVSRWIGRFSGHAVSPERAAEKILRRGRKNRYLIYTSPDIRALYAFKRLAWWPYSVAMRQVNVVFTRALRPSPAPR